jgi:hypothetical protein
VGKRFADVNVGNRVLHGGGGDMVWAISYGQQTQLHFIDGYLNCCVCHSSSPITSRFSIIMPRYSWKLKMSPFFHGLHVQTRHPLSMFGMLGINDPIFGINVYDSVFQFTINIQQLCTAMEE